MLWPYRWFGLVAVGLVLLFILSVDTKIRVPNGPQPDASARQLDLREAYPPVKDWS